MSGRGKKHAAAATPATNSQVLAPKETALFKAIVKCYETKLYKKGLKNCDAILKKHPEHGETLAMKGLIYHLMDKKPEGYELVRKGIKFNIMSHICWHVYGIIYRSDFDYHEAIKCYSQALRRDPNNQQILRDLSTLQAQTMDFEGYAESRKKILNYRPNNKLNWFPYIIALHLSKDYGKALRTIDAYHSTTGVNTGTAIEDTEFILYWNMIIEESGDYVKALKHLEDNKSKILEKDTFQQKKAELLIKNKKYADAQEILQNLLDINPENYEIHRLLQCSFASVQSMDENIPKGKLELLDSVYENLLEIYPRALSIRYIHLQLIQDGERFKEMFSQLLKLAIKKGIPSLFNSVKIFYKNEQKAKIIGELAHSFVKSLQSNKTFPGSETKESPLCELWTLFFLGQHLDKVGEFDEAIKILDEAIEHTPTVIEIYLAKARVVKHKGNADLAAEIYDNARKMDLADRCLNSNCTKYLLRANKVEQAETTIALFSREKETGKSNLHDMQCLWYESELGDAYFRLGKYGRALKQYNYIEKHYVEWYEDQLDFHTYSMRKYTFRAYINLVRLEQNLKSFHRFFNASSKTAQIYLHLYDQPKKVAEAEVDDLAHLSEFERKKELARRKKAEARKNAKQETKAASAAQQVKGKGGKGAAVPFVEEDPEGENLTKVEDLLTPALKAVKSLQRHSADKIETHLLACRVYLRKEKYAVALQALKKAIAADATHPEIQLRKSEFFKKVSDAGESINAHVLKIIKEEAEKLKE